MKVTNAYISLYKGIDLTQRRLPIIKIDSGNPGPLIWITAAIHGDEVTGIAIVQSLIRKLTKINLVRGVIYSFPIMNPSGFETISREEVNDQRDLNRCFGLPHDGPISQRHASLISDTILNTSPDLLIDLHTDSIDSIAYGIIDLPNTLEDSATFLKAIELAQRLGFPILIDTQENAGYPLDQCLSGNMLVHGIPAITLELGGNMIVVEKFRKKGLHAIWNLLKQFQMIPGRAEEPKSLNIPRKVYLMQSRLYAQSTGIIDYKIKPGDKVRVGDTLAKIRNVFGKTIEVLKSPYSGILISNDDQSIAFPGQGMVTLGVPSKLENIIASINSIKAKKN